MSVPAALAKPSVAPRSWQLHRTASTIIVRFQGHLTAAEGLASADALADALRVQPSAVEWDVRNMMGYDSGARSAWQHRIWPLRKSISSIKVIGASSLIRFGARALGLALGVGVTFDA